MLFTGALLVLWVAGGMMAFSLKQTQLFDGFDGGYMRDLAQRQFDWHVPLFTASIDFFQGLGDIFFPINFRLFPAFVAASSLGSGMLAKVVIYGCILAELSVASVMFGRSLGLSRTLSVAAMLLTCLVTFPFHGHGLVYGIATVAPQFETVVAAVMAMAAAFMYFGRRSWWADMPYALLMLTLLNWVILADIAGFILIVPFVLICGISGILAAANSYERWCKIGLGLVAGVMLVATGPALYLASVLIDTAAVTFPFELANDRATFQFASILFHWGSVGLAGPLLVVLAIAGSLVVIYERRLPTLRIFAITLLTYLSTCLTFAVLAIIFDFWRGPSPLYFELFVVPLYAIFAVLFVARILECIQNIGGWRPWWSAPLDIGLVTASVVLAIGFAANTPFPVGDFQFPPQANAFTQLLAEEAGMQRGSQFRGRTANITGRSFDRNITWFDLHFGDSVIAKETGNEMRVAGLHFFGIPSLFEYTPTISPAFYATMTRLLGRPGDVQMRSVTVLREIKPNILAMLGVRFVITDFPFEGSATLRVSLPIKDRILYLYEIAEPNIGNYSPTVVHSLPSASEMIELLRSADFDASRELIGDLPVPVDGLVKARNARLAFDGLSLKVEAESPGWSILLLPLEFSRCLATTSGQSGKPILFRANLLETGILFSGRLDTAISARTGPFLNPGCRLRDYFDVRSLRIGEIPPQRGTAESAPRGLPL
jgi:hypothetical protein